MEYFDSFNNFISKQKLQQAFEYWSNFQQGQGNDQTWVQYKVKFPYCDFWLVTSWLNYQLNIVIAGVWHSGKGNTQRCKVRCGGAGGLLGNDRPHIWKVEKIINRHHNQHCHHHQSSYWSAPQFRDKDTSRYVIVHSFWCPLSVRYSSKVPRRILQSDDLRPF